MLGYSAHACLVFKKPDYASWLGVAKDYADQGQ
jgi:hypothetical protein